MNPNEVYHTNIDRYQQLNERIAERNIPSGNLQSYFNVRPVSTKYSLMPIFDQYKPSDVKIPIIPNYNVGKTFNPGNAQGPWSGYANNVDVETVLRNQAFALQKGDRSVYVPSTNSDLYVSEVVGRNETQTHPYLFKHDPLPNFNPNTLNLGNDVFNNATRQQFKGIHDKEDNMNSNLKYHNINQTQNVSYNSNNVSTDFINSIR
jgi:hypothetical protein